MGIHPGFDVAALAIVVATFFMNQTPKVRLFSNAFVFVYCAISAYTSAIAHQTGYAWFCLIAAAINAVTAFEWLNAVFPNKTDG